LETVVESEAVPETTEDLLEASKLLLKKLTMLAMGDKTVDEFPQLLTQLLAQLEKTSHVPLTTESTTTTTPTTTKMAARTKNFRHRVLSNFYSSRNSVSAAGSSAEEGSADSAATDLEAKPEDPAEAENESRLDILSSLRSQIISTALKDRKIVAKANNLKIYYPGRKISSKSLRGFYDQATEDEAEKINQEHKEKETELQQQLAGELSASLRNQLVGLKDRVQQEYNRKSEYKAGVVNSVKQQLEIFASSLERKHETENSDEAPDLASALEKQLRAFYGDSY